MTRGLNSQRVRIFDDRVNFPARGPLYGQLDSTHVFKKTNRRAFLGHPGLAKSDHPAHVSFPSTAAAAQLRE